MSGEAAAGNNHEPLARILDIRLPGDPSAIGAATDTITETLTRLDVPEEKRMEIALAVQEALANAVVHGCQGDPSKEVHCQVERDDDSRILIIVTDPGPGFPVGSVPDPNSPQNLFDTHGRGVYLICELMDEVKFEGRGNQIRMWKY